MTKVYLKLNDKSRRNCKVLFQGCDYVLATGACPKCTCTDSRGGFPVAGRSGTMRTERDRYVSVAECVVCGADLGQLIVEVSTIFGLEEDERVLNGRPRVY